MLNRSRVKAFPGAGGEERAEKVGHYLKAMAGNDASRKFCVDRGIGLTRATNESGNTAGGFLAPQDFDAAIIAIRETVGAFRQGAEVRPSGSDNQVRPRRTGAATANFVREGAAIPESQLLFDAVETSQKKLGVLLRSSAELLEDSAPDFAEYVTAEIGYAFASVEDDVGFNGDGTSPYSGITGLGSKLVGMKSAVAAASGHNTFLAIDTTDISNLMAGVLATAIPGAAWYTSATGYAQTICRLVAGGGCGGLVARQRADGSISANFLGFPVIFSGKLPDVQTSLAGKPMLFFGNLAMSSVIVERQQQTVIAISSDRALDTDQVLIRGVRREDIVNHDVGDANTRGPIAMLVGGA
jgi:HK97 family phage major capsid protein